MTILWIRFSKTVYPYITVYTRTIVYQNLDVCRYEVSMVYGISILVVPIFTWLMQNIHIPTLYTVRKRGIEN